MSASSRRVIEAAYRTGVLEGVWSPLFDSDGRRYWRGRVRLQDGTSVRVKIPSEKRYDEEEARRYVVEQQRIEDEHHTLYNNRKTCKGCGKRFKRNRDESPEVYAKRSVCGALCLSKKVCVVCKVSFEKRDGETNNDYKRRVRCRRGCRPKIAYTLFGVSVTSDDLATIAGLSVLTVRNRLGEGRKPEEIITKRRPGGRR